MKITIDKITGVDLLKKCANCTINADSGQQQIGEDKKINLDKWYKSEHSPIRSQLFFILMEDIPSFVSTHLVRHKFGVEHYVKTNRDDRNGGGSEVANRNTPVTHGMLLNAQALIHMGRKRLCKKSHEKTIEVMQEIKNVLQTIDPALAKNIVKECEYRGKCNEFTPCDK